MIGDSPRGNWNVFHGHDMKVRTSPERRRRDTFGNKRATILTMMDTAKGIHGKGSPTCSASADRRWFRPAILAALAVGAGLRVAILVDHVRHNPFSQAPVTDGAVYWEWAGRIAGGEWIGATPYVSAPLYPYLLGLLRFMGGGLLAVYGAQVTLDLFTALVLAWVGRRRAGAAVGVVAALMYLVLDEPAFYTTRILNSTLQAFLVVILWVTAVEWQRRPAWWGCALIGLALGLNCLANPPMLLLMLVLPVWMIMTRREHGAGERPDRMRQGSSHPTRNAGFMAWRTAGLQTVGASVLAVLVIAPATWHNWRVCHEFIPITACPGITLRQGNGPGAIGTYIPIPGVSGGRDRLFSDAARVYQQATGRPVRWRDVDRFFRDQALAYWREDPFRAVRLFLRRGYWFLSGRYYGDVHQPSWERDVGIARGLWLAPVPTAWLIGLGLVGMAAVVRHPIRFAPELLFLAIPMFVVVVFQYSPRYRFPAVPVLVVSAAWAAIRLFTGRARVGWAIAVVVAGLMGVLLGPVNRATGFEEPANLRYNNEYNLAVALSRLGRDAEAVVHLNAALSILPTSAEAHNDLAILLARQGRPDEAINHYETALRVRPGWAEAENNLAMAYASRGDFARAIEHLRRARQAAPDMPEIAFNLANVLADNNQLDEAVRQYETVLSMNPHHLMARENLGLVLSRQGNAEKAIEAWQMVLHRDPSRVETRNQLATAMVRKGRYDEAIRLLREGLRTQPLQVSLANNLAWILATCPQDDLRRGDEAVSWAEKVCQASGGDDPILLDSLAAAYAEVGRFEQAVAVAQRAADLAASKGDSERLGRLQERLDLYRRGQAYRQKH